MKIRLFLPLIGALAFGAPLSLSFSAEASAQDANAAPTTSESEKVETYADKLADAIFTARAGDCPAAIDVLVPELSAAEYDTLTPDAKRKAHAALLECALDEGRWPEALSSVNTLLDLVGDNGYLLWLKFLLGDYVDGQALQSLDAAGRLAAVDPQRLSRIEQRQIFSLLRKLRATVAGDMRLPFLDSLWKAEYRPSDPTESLDRLRMIYARLLRDRQMSSRAAKLIREIENPLLIAEYLIDRRYDGLKHFRDMPKLKAMPRLVEDFVSAAKQVSADHPDRLGARLDYIQALRLAGAYNAAETEAAKTSTAVMASNAQEAFVDYREFAHWILNEWAYTLYDLGRTKEGYDVLAGAAAMKESGTSNVSQLINLSSLLVYEGRHGEALTEIAKLDSENASPFGAMWAANVKVCARAFSGTLESADPDLAFVRENRSENRGAYVHTMLCIDDLDAAAAQMIERLKDLDHRVDALQALQLTLRPPSTLPVSLILRERFGTLRARSDVQAAVENVGRIIELPFYPTYWGEF